MKKNDRLKNLIGSINTPTPQEDGTQNETSESALVQELGISPELEERLDSERKKTLGRPRGRKNGNPKQKENRHTFIVDDETVRKLKYIALTETRFYSQVVEEALEKYIAEWESENETINLPKKKEQ